MILLFKSRIYKIIIIIIIKDAALLDNETFSKITRDRNNNNECISEC